LARFFNRKVIKMEKIKYYAVRKGKRPGVYTSWADCEAQVKGVNGAEYKSFSAEEEADEYMLGGSNAEHDNNNDIDGIKVKEVLNIITDKQKSHEEAINNLLDIITKVYGNLYLEDSKERLAERSALLSRPPGFVKRESLDFVTKYHVALGIAEAVQRSNNGFNVRNEIFDIMLYNKHDIERYLIFEEVCWIFIIGKMSLNYD